MIRSPARAPQSLLALGACVALLCGTGPALAQAPLVVRTYPVNGATRVPSNAILTVVFDRPTGKQVRHSYVDLTAGGGIVSTVADRWSPLGDTLYIQPLLPLPFGHLFAFKLNQVRDTTGVIWQESSSLYAQIYTFTTALQAQVERVQAGNFNLSLTPDVTLPVSIPVRELAGTDVVFSSARVQFLGSPNIPDVGASPPFYEYTVPVSLDLGRNRAATLVAPVRLPSAYARSIPQGTLGVRLTFYGVDETASPVVVDAVFRADSATVTAHQASVLPALASDFLIRTAVLEWPLHGAVIAAGDTVLPRAVVTGNGTGAFRGVFYLDGEAVATEEGYMVAGRPVEIVMRGPLPLRRLGEHRLQFAVEAPQPLAANPISIVCAPPPNGVAPPEADLFKKPEEARVTPVKLHGTVTWLAEGRSKFREEKSSALGWGGWNGAYELSPTRRIEAESSARVRFDDAGNGSVLPQRMLVRYADPSRTLAYGDQAPARATETPLLMSAVPRRSALAGWRGTPLGDVEGFAALDSRPISVAGEARRVSDLYAATLRRSLWKEKVKGTLYGGYAHDKAAPVLVMPLGLAAIDSTDLYVRRTLTYGGSALLDLPGTWTLLADGATVRHRAPEGVAPAGLEGRARTGWRSELRGTAAGFTALAQGFSYQPEMVTALNPYALEDRRGGMVELERSVLTWRFTGSFRSEEPARRDGLVPVVRVQTATLATRVTMADDSWVTPLYVHVRHKGADTDFTEDRIGGEYTAAEPMGGRTTARFDATFVNDTFRAASKRRVVSGSLVTTRRHPGRVVSTITLGFEQNHSSGVNLTDTTVQGSCEIRWEAVAGRFLVIPFVSGASRHYDLEGTKEERYSAHLQLALLRVPGLGENAISLEGRADRVLHLQPSFPKDFDGSVQLTVGQRFSLPSL